MVTYEPLTQDRLFMLVRDMRKCQKEYFKTRAADILPLCKNLEKQVDALVKDIENQQRQLRLL